MVGETTILQHWVLTKFILPFLLVFFIIFAVLEKTKLFGDGKKQLNAITAFIVGLIFVGAISNDLILPNLILFLTISLVVVFVILLLWGFATGGEAKIENKAMKWIAGIVLVGGVIVALFMATGIWEEFVNTLFKQNWSNTFWTSVSFIIVIAVALALTVKGK